MNNFKTKRLARSGIIAAMYIVLTFLVLPVASGAIQFRASEALTLLPLFYVEAIPALFVGCLLSNIISGCVIWDIIIGSLITLVSAVITYYCGKLFKNTALKIITGGLAPVLLNAFLLPVIWYFAYGQLDYIYIAQVGLLTLSQGVVIYGLGTGLYFAIIAMQKKGIKVMMPYNKQIETSPNNSSQEDENIDENKN